MSKADFFSSESVKYPSKEKAMAFCDPDSRPFGYLMIGVTYPLPEYSVARDRDAGIYDLEYVVSGGGRVIRETGEEVHIRAGDTYLLIPGERHRYFADPLDPWKKIWVNFRCGYMRELLRAYGLEPGKYRADTRTYFDTILSLSQSRAPYSENRYRIADCIHGIITALSLSLYGKESSDARRILNALSGAVYEKRTLSDISRALGMSKSALIRCFKREYGNTPYDFLIGEKINAAKMLLGGTKMSVKEIAQKLCFSDEHHFSSIFLSRAGMRPGEYRRSFTS